MILWLGYEVFPKAGRASVINTYLNHVYSLDSEEAATWPFPYSQGMADLVKRRH